MNLTDPETQLINDHNDLLESLQVQHFKPFSPREGLASSSETGVIPPDTINDIINRIKDRFRPKKIVLFGSYATGDATEDSDVDLLIVADTDLPVRERFPAVSRLLADFPAAFDVILKTPEEYERTKAVVNHIVYFADKYGKVVYE